MKKLILLLMFPLSLSAELKLDFSREYDSTTESYGIGIEAISDGLFLIGGISRNELVDTSTNTPPAMPSNEAFFIKVDKSGEPIFETIFGDGTALQDYPVAMVQSGSYTYITGVTVGKISTDDTASYGKTDIFLGKFDSSTGSTEWITQIGTGDDEFPISITADSRGSIYISGESYDGVETKHLFLEYNSSGEVVESTQNSTAKTEIDTSFVKYDSSTDRLFLAYSVDDTDTVGSRIFLDVTDFANSSEDSIPLNIEDELVAFDFHYSEDSEYTEFYFLTLSSGSNKLYKKVFDSNFTLISEAENDTDFSSTLTSPDLKLLDGKLFIGDGSVSLLREFSTEDLTLSGETVIGSSSETYSWGFNSDGNSGLYVTGETLHSIIDGSLLTNEKHNLFIANYRPVMKTIPAGWSLLSGNIDIGRVPDSVTILYNYDSFFLEWRAFSPIESINSALIDYTDLPQIEEFKKSDGMWVLTSETTEIEFTEDSDTVLDFTYEEGWSLNGTDQNISTSDISCSSGVLDSVWRYSGGVWQIDDNTEFSGFTEFSEISEKDGFWVNCKAEDPPIE